MQITDSQTDESSLGAFGAEAIGFLHSGDIRALADRFGYAIAFNREPADAIQKDLASCLVQLQASGLAPSAEGSTAAVKYLPPNNAGLFALIECRVPTDSGAELLLELVVTNKGQDKHVTLEQISVAA